MAELFDESSLMSGKEVANLEAVAGKQKERLKPCFTKKTLLKECRDKVVAAMVKCWKLIL